MKYFEAGLDLLTNPAVVGQTVIFSHPPTGTRMLVGKHHVEMLGQHAARLIPNAYDLWFATVGAVVARPTSNATIYKCSRISNPDLFSTSASQRWSVEVVDSPTPAMLALSWVVEGLTLEPGGKQVVYLPAANEEDAAQRAEHLLKALAVGTYW